MALNINDDAAAYGLFQVAFAGLDTRLSGSLVALLRSANPNLAFAIVKTLSFHRRLEVFRKVIKTFKQGSYLDQVLCALREASNKAEALSQWRNERIHAEVRLNENQTVIVGKDGKPLQIDYAVCEEKIREAIDAVVAMEANVQHLVARLEQDDRFDELYAQLDP
jgi:hypothetical protein